MGDVILKKRWLREMYFYDDVITIMEEQLFMVDAIIEKRILDIEERLFLTDNGKHMLIIELKSLQSRLAELKPDTILQALKEMADAEE